MWMMVMMMMRLCKRKDVERKYKKKFLLNSVDFMMNIIECLDAFFSRLSKPIKQKFSRMNAESIRMNTM